MTVSTSEASAAALKGHVIPGPRHAERRRELKRQIRLLQEELARLEQEDAGRLMEWELKYRRAANSARKVATR